MLQAEAIFVSKHDVIPFRCPCSPFIVIGSANACGLQSRNDAWQRMRCAMVRDVAVKSITALHTIRLSSRAEVKRWKCDHPHRFLLHAAMTITHHSCLVSSSKLTDFCEG
ncbi:hypothetical protein TNCV_3111701 [Trichonephila clavipes]|nr:hypothetical protein TNCV_3111701 [Trichonephila clavipes]